MSPDIRANVIGVDVLKSELFEVVQPRVTCVSPAVVLVAVAPFGERLSTVIVALPVSVPDWLFVLVKAVTVPVVS